MSVSDDEFWREYQQYLVNNLSQKTIIDHLLYSKRYIHVLQTGDARELHLLSLDKRRHAMKALASLAKFTGCYDYWRQIRERHQLKWSKPDDLTFFNNMLGNEENFTNMVKWLKEAVARLPTRYGNILLYNALTGLRPSEALYSIAFLQSDRQKYLNENKMMLEHYRFAKIFLRKTKKAYISLVNDRILDLAQQSGHYEYSTVQNALWRAGMPSNTNYCRKIFATHLRKQGEDTEIIDMLQGRVPKTIFARHYFRPDIDFNNLRTKINGIIEAM